MRPGTMYLQRSLLSLKIRWKKYEMWLCTARPPRTEVCSMFIILTPGESDGAAVSRCVLSRRLRGQKGWPETSTARQEVDEPYAEPCPAGPEPRRSQGCSPQLTFHHSSQLFSGYSEKAASRAQGLCVFGLHPGGLSSL